MDDNDNKPTPDDALEPADTGMFHPDSDEEKLEQDFDPPAAPPSDVTGKPIPPDDPDTDSKLDSQEEYDEGRADAARDNREEENPGDRPQQL